MKILLLGSGGREHALAWKIAQSPKVEKLYIAPGNAGTGAVGENVNMKATDFPAIKAFALEKGVDETICRPFGLHLFLRHDYPPPSGVRIEIRKMEIVSVKLPLSSYGHTPEQKTLDVAQTGGNVGGKIRKRLLGIDFLHFVDEKHSVGVYLYPAYLAQKRSSH